jgi:hypothetical protein
MEGLGQQAQAIIRTVHLSEDGRVSTVGSGQKGLDGRARIARSGDNKDSPVGQGW